MTFTTWAAVAFAIGVTMDFLYVNLNLAIVAGQKWRAALFSMAVGTCSLTGLASVICHDHLLAPFLVLGYGAGTLLTMTLKESKKKT